MKKCFKCGEDKDLDLFYKHSRMKDGYLNKCKECTKKDTHNHRHFSNRREYILAYDRARGGRQSNESLREYRKRFPKKYKSHSIVNYAIKSGKLFKEPCSVCGKENAHAHHDDYDKPLNVRWLCSEHHHQWHIANGEGLNAS